MSYIHNFVIKYFSQCISYTLKVLNRGQKVSKNERIIIGFSLYIFLYAYGISSYGSMYITIQIFILKHALNILTINFSGLNNE